MTLISEVGIATHFIPDCDYMRLLAIGPGLIIVD